MAKFSDFYNKLNNTIRIRKSEQLDQIIKKQSN